MSGHDHPRTGVAWPDVSGWGCCGSAARLLMAGCLTGPPPPDYRGLSSDDARQEILRNSRNMADLSAVGGACRSSRAEWQGTLSGALLMRPPGYLRLRAHKLVQEIFDLVVTPSTVELYVHQDCRRVQGLLQHDRDDSTLQDMKRGWIRALHWTCNRRPRHSSRDRPVRASARGRRERVAGPGRDRWFANRLTCRQAAVGGRDDGSPRGGEQHRASLRRHARCFSIPSMLLRSTGTNVLTALPLWRVRSDTTASGCPPGLRAARTWCVSNTFELHLCSASN